MYADAVTLKSALDAAAKELGAHVIRVDVTREDDVARAFDASVGAGFFNAACEGFATPGSGPLQAASVWTTASVDTGSSVAVGPGWLVADSAK